MTLPANVPCDAQQRIMIAKHSGIWYIDDLLAYIASFMPPAPPV